VSGPMRCLELAMEPEVLSSSTWKPPTYGNPPGPGDEGSSTARSDELAPACNTTNRKFDRTSGATAPGMLGLTIVLAAEMLFPSELSKSCWRGHLFRVPRPILSRGTV